MKIYLSSFALVFALVVVPSIAFAAAPTVSTFSPSDGENGVQIDTNLSITFSESVTATTTTSSFVTIKKISDDSTFEAIDVSGNQISGSGSATITINPNSDLDLLASYYVQIDNDAFYNGTDEYYAGIADTTTWNFTTQGRSSENLIMPPAPNIDVRTSGTTATVVVSYFGGSSVTTDFVGFTYAKDDDGDENVVAFDNATNGFSYIIRDLMCGQTYTFQAYAENSIGTSYSGKVDVNTESCTEEVSTGDEEEVEDAVDSTEDESDMGTQIDLSIFSEALINQVPNDLSVGSNGTSVMYLQMFLAVNNTGLAARELLLAGPTGYFGRLTKAALAEYQLAHGIFPSLGYYGPITRNYIKTH